MDLINTRWEGLYDDKGTGQPFRRHMLQEREKPVCDYWAIQTI